jgi:glycosyltransferase involved in cell wall biosynthesis
MEGGGAERQLTYLAKELVAAGCEVHVALTRGGQNLARLEATGATVHMLGPCSNHDPRIATRLLRTISGVKPDLVQCWLLQMELLGGLACLATRTPWVFGERSSANAYPRTPKNRLRIRIASCASGIVSNSAAGDEFWQARVKAGIPRYVVRNALPMDEIAAVPAATPAEMGTKAGEALVLFAGRLDAAKNPITFVHALRRLTSPMPVHALLCGDGPLRPEIEHLIAEHGIERIVRVAGYASNLWSLMKRAAMFVSSSRFEGSPNVVLEAMACGCPLIVSDIPTHRELLDAESAIFVAADDPDGIARAIETVLADPAGAARRAGAARQRAERYASALIAQQYLDVYRDVLSRQPRGSHQMAS